MKVISRKSEVQPLIEACIQIYFTNGLTSCIEAIDNRLLCSPVKFPLLEYCGYELYRNIKQQEQLVLCDGIEKLKREGGNVLLGTILQRRLEDHFEASIQKAVTYITQASYWYTPDIIGERVFGVALIKNPERTMLEMQLLFTHNSNWVIRSLGAGIHYAIKRGLAENYVRQLFQLLLKYAKHDDKEVRQGIGWAAKTTARFHPLLIEFFIREIEDNSLTDNWFRSKIISGLNPPPNKFEQF